MEWLSSIVNGTNGLFALGLIALIIAAGLVLIKNGILSFQGKGVILGTKEKELAIIRKQMQYMNTTIDAIIRDIPQHLTDGLHYYRAKYILSKLKDLMEECIIYNHIEDSDEYIGLKQEVAYNLILKLTVDDFFLKPEFKEYIYKLIDKLIKRFVRIRKTGE